MKNLRIIDEEEIFKVNQNPTIKYEVVGDYGVLIIDDYGHWEGAREAVDEYFSEKNIRILLNRIDYTGRIAIKI